MTSPYTPTDHPSFLALDRAHLGIVAPGVGEHLEHCAECQRYVAELALPVITGVASARAITQHGPVRPSAWMWGSGLLAAAASVTLFFATQGNPALTPADPGPATTEDVYVGAKGFRSVWVYVKHGNETRLWDGRQALSSGDQVRLKLDPGRYRHVEVYSRSEAEGSVLLYQAAVTPGRVMTLPEAWEIDDSPLPEHLFVIFSDAPVTPKWDEWSAGNTPPNVALLPIVLPKTGSNGAKPESMQP